MKTNRIVFKELDSLRALAVIMTLASHWQTRVGSERIPYLWYGVDIFFAISGFLITGILLQINQTENKLKALKNFYIRRALRLFPAYYLLILVFCVVLNVFSLYIWDNQWNVYYFTYLANWYWFLHPNMGNGSFNHIWSLGVEEQFYLVWPWLIVFLPVQHTKTFLLGVVAFALLIHFGVTGLPKAGMLPFFNLHTLGIGAVLAYMYFREAKNRHFRKIVTHSSQILVISTTLLLYLLLFHPLRGRVENLFVQTCLCAATGILVLKSVYGWGRFAGLVFGSRYLQFIGTISYGIYLYHMPIPDTFKALAGKFGYTLDFKQHPVFYLLLFCTLTFLVALFSYKFIEMPFLKMKSKFAMERTGAEKQTAAQPTPVLTASSKRKAKLGI